MSTSTGLGGIRVIVAALGAALSLVPLALQAFGSSWLAAGTVSVLGLAVTVLTWSRLTGAFQSLATVLGCAGENAESLGAACRSLMDSLRAEAAAANRLIEVAPLPVFSCDAEGRVAAASQAARDLLGFGGHVRSVAGEAGGRLLERALREGRSLAEDMHVAGGGVRQLSVSPLSGPDGRPAGAVLCLIDQSARQACQEELQSRISSYGETAKQFSDRAERVASAAEELSASADEQAHGAKRQKEQTETVAAALEQMTASVLEVARNAAETNTAGEDAKASAKQGVDLARQAVRGVGAVSESVGRLSQAMSQLDTQAGEIDRVINVINEIADQTNLLALNAAIEAARAGDAGRGFAVVADEVRKLAEKTMHATKEVGDAIRAIQHGAREVIGSMRVTERQTAEGAELANQAGLALEQIMSRIEDMAQRVGQIATAAEEQSSAAEEISAGIEDIAAIAKEADESASQTAAATRDLAELSQELLTLSLSMAGKSEASKLLSSEGQMKGVLPKLLQEYVKERYGDEVFARIQQEMGEPVFLSTASYPDRVLHQMAGIVEKAAGVSPRDFFLQFGRFTMPRFYAMYRRYFKTGNLKDFLLRMNDTHAELTREQPGIKPPRFSYEDKGAVLFMNYSSGRGLFDYFEGILHGAAEHFKTKVQIDIKPLDGETARAEIRFANA